jgi:hypothetical protein
MVLDPGFVAGIRPDGRPNLSHAWARTVEGAQGGTWDQVHLLGNAALDRETGYVGQSRGRSPTHTWNVRRLPEVDYGGQRVQAPSAADEVGVALEREDRQVFAATEDPYVLDRKLRTERARHQEALARRPPDVDIRLRRARAAAEKEANEYRWAVARQSSAQCSLEEAGRLRHRFTRAGRHGRDWAEGAERRARQDVPIAKDSMDGATAEVRRLESAKQAREAFDRREAWRDGRMAEIDDQLEHHWAGVVLSAVREGEPLTYGRERLEQARFTYAADLRGARADPAREGHGLREHDGDVTLTSRQQPTVGGRGELSAVVAELDEAMETTAPTPLERSLSIRIDHGRSPALKELRPPPPRLEYGHDLGLGR